MWRSGDNGCEGGKRSEGGIIGEFSCVCGAEGCVWGVFERVGGVISITYCPLWSFGERCDGAKEEV